MNLETALGIAAVTFCLVILSWICLAAGLLQHFRGFNYLPKKKALLMCSAMAAILVLLFFGWALETKEIEPKKEIWFYYFYLPLASLLASTLLNLFKQKTQPVEIANP